MHHGEPEESEPEPRSFQQRDDAEPSFERHQPEPEAVQHRGHSGPAPEPETASAATAPAATAPAAAPPVSPAPASRRGSTVREPAPTSHSFGGEASTPVPAARAEPEPPAPASSTESEDAARPRRTGWWSKRVLGKG
jgi:ribonuclease E